jgi:hypothetical protein
MERTTTTQAFTHRGDAMRNPGDIDDSLHYDKNDHSATQNVSETELDRWADDGGHVSERLDPGE